VLLIDDVARHIPLIRDELVRLGYVVAGVIVGRAGRCGLHRRAHRRHRRAGAALGIRVTDRRHAAGVAFVTGHSQA
jgi:hypothetical protein